MIHEIWVDNFRSLEDFRLHIEPGLNVLVGPNGAGKTSIMKWFEFLSLLSRSSLRESIGKVGGANHVFRRQHGKYSEHLKFYFSGQTRVDTAFVYGRKRENDLFIGYDYQGEISVIKNQIFFSSQKTNVWICQQPLNAHSRSIDEAVYKARKKKPNIAIDWKYDALTDEITAIIETNKPKFILENSIESYHFEDKSTLADILKSRQCLEHLIVPHQFLPIDFLYSIKDDINYKKAININPASVRSATDISLQPGVQFDGAGLVSTLYDIKADNKQGRAYRYTTNGITRRRDTYEKVLSYFKISDQHINEIHADIDSFRNEFNVEVEYTTADSSYKVPIFLLSDGTLKWLAIVTALATENQSLFIEEPENFLHPRLQESIVEICREEINGEKEPRFAFLTTHSETLLNKLKPEEIIITNMRDGKTTSSRIENPDEISSIISESGFGLGYFYVSGGF